MKKECEIVQDLLFGYQDETLHTASKELVEKHLKKCEECNKVFNEMKKDDVEENEQEKEIDYLKKVKKKMRKKNKLLTVIGIVLAIIILFNVFIFVYYYHEARKVQIYLNNDITEEQMEDIKNAITNIDKNAKIEYHPKEDALNELKERFNDNKELLSGYSGDNNPLNAYYVIDVSIENARKMEGLEETLPGIKQITSNINYNPYEFLVSKIAIELTSN